MNIFLTGGTGFVGSYLRPILLREGHLLTIVSRSPEKYESETAENQRFISWKGNLSAEMQKADVIINMAGYSIFGNRWTDEVKEKIYSSRIDRTRQIVNAIQDAGQQAPELLISTSAAGYYGDQGSDILDESANAGDDFLAKVCIDWEEEAQKVTTADVRLAIPRFGIVLEKDGGALQKMLPAFKCFVGGPVGSGNQYFPWIHMHDLCRALVYPIKNETLMGAYNLNAPNPVTMEEFANTLASQINRPAFFKVPEFVLDTILGEAANPITNSLRLQPKKLQQHGFDFRFPYLKEALGDIL